MTLLPRMPRWRWTWRYLIGVAALSPCASSAQSVVTEQWPEIDVFWQPAVHQRTMLELSAVAEREGAKRDAAVGIYQDYLKLPLGYLRGGFRYTFSTEDASFRESRLVAEGVISRAIWFRWRALNRARLEWRWINGDPSYRVRDRVQLQLASRKTRGVEWLPYGTFEAYFDSRYSTISRLGARVGTDARLSRRIATDLYLARQENSRGSPPAVNALGIVVKLSY
jgi:hypothetical protein